MSRHESPVPHFFGQLVRELHKLSPSIAPLDFDANEARPTILSQFAQDELEQRMARTRHFPEEYFGEPVWDMLLYLYVAHVAGEPVRTKCLAITASLPLTTALRCITFLEKEGLVVRHKATEDNRVTLVSLSEVGIWKVESCLECRATGLLP